MPVSNEQQTILLGEIQTIVTENESPNNKLSLVCNLLRDKIPHYDWVGFYFVSHGNKRELILGPYAGEPTEHTCIPFGQGICGQAADSGETIIVDDVNTESNYLSCNINVKSEIVLPLYHDGELLGQIDIDSHTASVFDESDRAFLEMVGCLVNELLR